MKKTLIKKVVCVAVMAMVMVNQSFVSSAEEVSSEEVIPVEEFVYTCNHIESGETVIIDDEWEVSCTELHTCKPMGAYSNSKSETRVYRVKKLGANKVAFSITQSVSYIINTENDTVQITSYKTSLSNNTSGLQYRMYAVETYTNYPNKSLAAGNCAYDIFIPSDGWHLIGLHVSVRSTGVVSFDFSQI